jgi:hypothetical protein
MISGTDAPLLVGCGVLAREIHALASIRRTRPCVELLSPSLHIDCEALGRALGQRLAKHAGRPLVVFYGDCHPRMDAIVAAAPWAVRTPGQNCLEMLLGRERFQRELEGGAFFLLENWARTFERMLVRTFGTAGPATRAIFQDSHTHLLAVRTPCSGDFTAAAERAAGIVGLPLRWTDASLDHLESVLEETFGRLPGSPEVTA